MLTLYRRHSRSCKRLRNKKGKETCRCPIWIRGVFNEIYIRKSLAPEGVENLEQAEEWKDRWKRHCTSQAPAENKKSPVTLAVASEKFLTDAEARKLNEATIYKYKLLFKQFAAFATARGIRFLNELDVDALGTFRSEWKDGPRSSLKKLERMRAFFHFAERRKWVSDNPAQGLKAPKVSLCPTLPFTHDEMVRIIAATNEYIEQTSKNGKSNGRRLPALILLMRYSGMRIGDAVGLTIDRIRDNRLFLYTAKTGTPVYTVLPDFVIAALDKAPHVSATRFFWSGSGKLNTAVRVWETRLRRLFKLAGIANGHAHQFRDTFAVELLLVGVPMERVSVLLGHSSIRVTEKHYSPWVRSRQEQLEADVTRAWSRDPMVLSNSEIGTNSVHETSERPN